MRPLRLTPQARSDLLEITHYVLDNSGTDRAESVVGVIREAIEKVADMPGIGHKREELTDLQPKGRPKIFLTRMVLPRFFGLLRGSWDSLGVRDDPRAHQERPQEPL